MQTRKRSGSVGKAGLLLLFGWMLLGGTLAAQSDSISLARLFDHWQETQGYSLAYDAQLLASYRVPADFSERPPRAVWTELRTQFNLCHSETRPEHFLVFPCAEAPWDLRGRIQDRASGESLPYATIRYLDQEGGAVADANGQFLLAGISAETVHVQVRYIGYATDTFAIERRAKPMALAIAEKDYTLKQVNIESLMDVAQVENDFGHVAIETDLLPALPSVVGPDPLNSIRLLPGIGGNPESGTGIVMRGSKFDQTMILYDQVPLLHLNHFFGLFSSVNQNSIKDIRVYRSGYSAKYSGFAGGMVKITAREGDQERIHAGVSLDRYTTGLSLQVPLFKGKWTNIVNFRSDNYWMGDDFWNRTVTRNLIREQLNASLPDVGGDVADRSEYYFYDLSFKSVLRINDRHRISAGMQWSEDNLANAVGFQDPDLDYGIDLDFRSFWLNNGFYVRWDHRLGHKWDGSAQYILSNYWSWTTFYELLERRGADTLQNLTGFYQYNTYFETRFRYDLTHSAKNDRRWNLGLDIPVTNAGIDLADLDLEFIEPDTNFGLLPAAYLEHEWEPGRWSLKTGIRSTVDVTGDSGSFYLEPRISIARRLGEYWRGRMNYGIYNQFAQQFQPAVREGLVPDFWLLLDSPFPDLVQSHIFTLGATWQKEGWLFDAEGYAKTIGITTEQFPELSRLLPPGPGSLSAYTFGFSNIFGLDLMASRRLRHFTAWAGGDLMRIRNSADSISAFDYQPYYANGADFKTGLLYTRKNWEFGLTWRWQGGRRTTSISSVPTIDQVIPGNERFPDYHRLDAAVTYRFRIRGISGSIHNSFFNVYNRRNLRTSLFTTGANGQIERRDAANLGFLYNLKLTVGF
ncbi:MAG: carboxypeptidase-like regulatory domain-containing protein [Bacteroidota bacterium]